MTTALDIIKRSMRLLQVYAIGEEPSSDEAQAGLTALNALVQSWGNSPLLIHAQSLDQIPLTAGTGSYIVGPGLGGFVTARPMEVLEASFVRFQGVDYPLSVLTLDDLNAIPVKTISGIPTGVYAHMDMPNITLTLYPVPSQAMTLHLWSVKAVPEFPGLTSSVILPPGYEQALAFLLAETLAPEYETQPSAQVMREAARVRRAIKRTNLQVPRLNMPFGVPMGGDYMNWRVL